MALGTKAQRSTRSTSGKVAVITGGGRGIGAATARALADRGATVVVGDIDAEHAQSVASEIGGESRALGLEVDVSDRASFGALIDTAIARFGRVDILVNNAGIMPLGPLTAESADIEDRIMGVNVRGVITGTKLVTPTMIAAGGGHIVNIASAVGRVAIAHGATYSASKYAVVGYSEASRAELRSFGIDVSCILPTVVATDLAAGVQAARGMHRVTPEEIAAAVVAVLAKPRFESWVPHRGHRMWAVSQMLPRRAQDAIMTAIGADTALSHADTAARAVYEKEACGGRPTSHTPTP